MNEKLKEFFKEKAAFEKEQEDQRLTVISEATNKLFDNILSAARASHFATKVRMETSEISKLCDEGVFASEAVLMLVEKGKGQIKSSRNGTTYTFELIPPKD